MDLLGPRGGGLFPVLYTSFILVFCLLLFYFLYYLVLGISGHPFCLLVRGVQSNEEKQKFQSAGAQLTMDYLKGGVQICQDKYRMYPLPAHHLQRLTHSWSQVRTEGESREGSPWARGQGSRGECRPGSTPILDCLQTGHTITLSIIYRPAGPALVESCSHLMKLKIGLNTTGLAIS